MSIEIRKNRDGSLDEVVADNCNFHLEQMNDGHWWMMVSVKGPSGPTDININLSTKRGAKINASISVQ